MPLKQRNKLPTFLKDLGRNLSCVVANGFDFGIVLSSNSSCTFMFRLITLQNAWTPLIPCYVLNRTTFVLQGHEGPSISFQTFFVWALLLIVHTWNSSPLRSNLLRLQCPCTVSTLVVPFLEGPMEEFLCERVNNLRHSLFHFLNSLITTASKFFLKHRG